MFAGGKNSCRIVLQDFQPRLHVTGVVFHASAGQAQAGNEKRAPKLGYQFFECIRVTAKSTAEVAVKS